MKKNGIGHDSRSRFVKYKKEKQISFFKTDWKHNLSYGGLLRNLRGGRGQRPVSSKEPLHVVFKINVHRLRHRSLRSARGHSIAIQVIKKYSAYFAVNVEQLSIQNDHIHILVRTSRRSQFHHFFRVVAGQIAQRFEKEGLFRCVVTDTQQNDLKLWKYRPFSRVVRGWKAYKTVRNYIQLNEKEVRGELPYRKQRLRGLSTNDWEDLWP